MRSFDYTQDLKIAIVHDYLKEYGGAERVVEAIHDIFPDAPIFTAFYDPSGFGPHADRVKKWDIRTSFIQKLPFAKKLLSPFRVFAAMAFESFDFSGFDVVISSDSIYFAKAVITAPETLHIAYIHTPPRYLYGYATSFNYKKNPIIRILAEVANSYLRIIDFETSQRPDILIANSKNVVQRIKKFYRRDAVIIYPPVDLEEFKVKSAKVKVEKGDYYLTLNRLWKSKGTDVVVKAASELNVPLKVVGEGPEMGNLKKIAGNLVEFLGNVTDEQRVKLFLEAKALITASEEEDFGINAVEAQAAGTPVIAIKAGGYLESVIEGKTGIFFSAENPVQSLMEVLQIFDPSKFKAEDCRKQAEKFSKDRFKKEILDLITKNLNH